MKRQSLLILTIILLIAFQSFGQITQNYIPKFSGSTGTINNSEIYQTNLNIGIGTTSPESTLHLHAGNNPRSEKAVLKITSSWSDGFSFPGQPSYLAMSGRSYIDFDVSKSGSVTSAAVGKVGFTKGFDEILLPGQSYTEFLFFGFGSQTTNTIEYKMLVHNSGDVRIGLGGNFNASSRFSVNAGDRSVMAQFINDLEGGCIQIVGDASKGIIKNSKINKALEINTTNSLGAVNNYQLYLAQSGSVGIGTSSPNSKLHINSASGETGLRVQVNGSSKFIVNSNGSVTIGSTSSGPANGLYVSGSVGIGTTSVNNYKLAIAGKMIAEEVVVKLQANWPDYVFGENYDLKSLREVEQYINDHKHLPNVPSAKEIEEKGISIGEMNSILLEKIEELTLYIIELKKDNNELKSEINLIKKVIAHEN